VQVKGTVLVWHPAELADVVAEEIHARKAETLELGDGCRLDLIGVEVTEEEVERLPGVFAAHEGEHCLPRPCPPREKFIAQRIHQTLSPVDIGDFYIFDPSLLASMHKVGTPQVISRDRVPLKALQATEKDAHRLAESR
jgi:hypothetical protein